MGAGIGIKQLITRNLHYNCVNNQMNPFYHIQIHTHRSMNKKNKITSTAQILMKENPRTHKQQFSRLICNKNIVFLSF